MYYHFFPTPELINLTHLKSSISADLSLCLPTRKLDVPRLEVDPLVPLEALDTAEEVPVPAEPPLEMLERDEREVLEARLCETERRIIFRSLRGAKP